MLDRFEQAVGRLLTALAQGVGRLLLSLLGLVLFWLGPDPATHPQPCAPEATAQNWHGLLWRSSALLLATLLCIGLLWVGLLLEPESRLQRHAPLYKPPLYHVMPRLPDHEAAELERHYEAQRERLSVEGAIEQLIGR